jgi:hypothetical protein
MNQETIPDNNLAVYLQQYDVKIFDDKKESVGNVLYTTVGAIPSNEKEKRVWSLNLTGYLKPNVDKYNITYDFSEVDYPEKNITFENIVSGTFTICGRVLDASKIVGFDYKYNDKESTLTIELDTSKWDFRLKNEVLFSYQLNVDDCSVTEYSLNSESVLTTTINGASFTIFSFQSTCFGQYIIGFTCRGGGGSQCNCNTDIQYTLLISGHGTHPFTNLEPSLPPGCSDSSVNVVVSDLSRTDETVTVSWET